MIPDKFNISLDNLSGKKQMLHGISSLRRLPCRRLVSLAKWGDQEVVAKLFFGSSRAPKKWGNEVAGLQAFQRHGIVAPSILHAGTAENSTIYVVLLKYIADAESLDLVWRNCANNKDKISLLSDVINILAEHHQAGLVQHDLHLNNFLYTKGTIYTLDAGDVENHGKSLARSASLSNVGLLFAQLLPENDRFVQPVLAAYMELRGWPCDSTAVEMVGEFIKHHRRKRTKKYLKKIFRQCTEFICLKDFSSYRVFRRDFASPELENLIKFPDESLSLPGTRILKKGNSSTVWLTSVGSVELVVKRYNIKGFWHGLKRALRRSRASISWENAHLLKTHGVLTASPIALVEERFALFRRRAWFICEKLTGTDALQVLKEKEHDLDADSAEIGQLVELLRQMGDFKIAHGDMKATNIIFSDCGPALIDLDSMKQCRSSFFFKKPHKRDLVRFMQNWQDMPAIHKVFGRLLGKE